MRMCWSAMLVVALLSGMASAADAPSPNAWRDVLPENLLLIQTRAGQIAVELSPEFASHHVERMRKLTLAHFYDGLSFYRVIDGFVAQGGADQDTSATSDAPVNPQLLKDWPKLKAEFDRPIEGGGTFTALGNSDLFAPESGFVNGFPVGRDPADKHEWIIHCPGTFAFARDNDADTATTEFYIVIGEAPRRLDRNLTAFGRVIDGMQYVQRLERGDPDVDAGVIADVTKRDPILKARMASDLPPTERPHYQVMRTDSPDFAAFVDKKRHPAPEFYHRPPLANLDVCSITPPVRKVSP